MRRRLNGLILIGVCISWVILGEVGVYYIQSLRWEWPELGLSRQDDYVKHDPDIFEFSQLNHFQKGDVHLYARSSGKEEVVSEERAVREEPLRVMFISDPHIMCTYAV